MSRLFYNLFVNRYNYTDFHELNLDWIISDVRVLAETLEKFININTIKYADPIQWNITKQYEANTVVIDANTGTAYLSTQPVPKGVALTNSDYWTTIFTLDIISSNPNITFRNDGSNVLATFASDVDDWLIWNNSLYIVTRHIAINEAYVVGYNLTRYSVELFIKDYISAINTIIGDLNDLNTTDKTNLVAAINELITVIGDLNDLNTTDKSNLVAAINEVLNTCDIDIVTPQMFGAVGDGVHDDTTAIESALAQSKMVYFPNGEYKITHKITLPSGSHLKGINAYNKNLNLKGAVIVNYSNEDTFVIPSYTSSVIEDLTLTKDSAVYGTGTGVSITLSDTFTIKNVNVSRHDYGIKVSGCGFGYIERCFCTNNYTDGFHFTNNDTLITCQVQVIDNYAQYNNRHGFCYLSVRNGMQTGKFEGNMTFANGGAGVFISGDAVGHSVSGMRINDCFIGGDGLGGIYIGGSTFPTTITDSTLEAAGTANCGVDGQTSAPNMGHNIEILSGYAKISNCIIASSAQSGIQLVDDDTIISDCSFLLCGQSPALDADSLQKSGVTAIARTIVKGSTFKNMRWGVYNYTNKDFYITDNIFDNTVTDAVGNVLSNVKIKFNIGVADN